MMRNRRAGTLPHAREGSGPRVEPIDPPADSALVHMDLQHVDDNALRSGNFLPFTTFRSDRSAVCVFHRYRSGDIIAYDLSL